jgi:hypothetical protein
MLLRAAPVRTDVSEELSAFFIRVTRIVELGTTLAVTSNRRTLRRNTLYFTYFLYVLHVRTSQETHASTAYCGGKLYSYLTEDTSLHGLLRGQTCFTLCIFSWGDIFWSVTRRFLDDAWLYLPTNPKSVINAAIFLEIVQCSPYAIRRFGSTLVLIRTTQRYIPENGNIHNYD